MENSNEKIAFVEIEYADSGPSMGGYGPNEVFRAQVIQVNASDVIDALSKSKIKFKETDKYGMTRIIRINFLRWIDEN